MCLNVIHSPGLSDAWRRKTIKEHTKNVTDFNIKQLFPTTWVDSIQDQCQAVFHKELFQCKNNVFINVLTPQKRHRLSATPEGGFIFAYATFAFLYQMKKSCIENDEYNCGCNACRLHYPSSVCEKLMERTPAEAFGGCDLKSRHALSILDTFMESYLDEVAEFDEELALLIQRNMIVGRKEALKMIRKIVDISRGKYCDCALHYCPEQTPRSCLMNYLYKQEGYVAHTLFELYKVSVRAELTNDSLWIEPSAGDIIREKNIIYTKSYEPDCDKEVKGRTCLETRDGYNYTPPALSSNTLMPTLTCDELCGYCQKSQNYTIRTEVESTDCNCKMDPVFYVLKCEVCSIVVHKCLYDL
ncbi:protein Wnt-8a-like isoform X2 [Convolutriloba macropyga]|uniref:protein Wnt-8a-like isoform X2 n=1 Tax=Convolutriloba macropyga TaxID=536237 RepID=UPI003F52040D